MRLKGKTALVTGASRGIGRAIALGYAREGAAVVVNFSRSLEAAQDAVREIRAGGGKAVAIRADIGNPDGLDPLIDQTLAEFGSLDIPVNNARIEFNEAVLDARPETWEQTVAVNLKGPYFLAVMAARAMMRSGSGTIVNISSM
jgi:NAD(P)-dependent dehydrogenase (short-subunit alcohol dehydrogenase family)